MNRRRSGGDPPLSPICYSENSETLPPITEHIDLEEPDSLISSGISLNSTSSTATMTKASVWSSYGKEQPSHPHKLKKSDSKKSFSGIISKIMKQNKTAKLLKEESASTKKSFRPKQKLMKSISLPMDRKRYGETRSLSADQGYESSDPIYTTNSSEEDDDIAEITGFRSKIKNKFRRSFSAPGMATQDSLECRQQMASRHWDWYLRSSSSTWQSFNTHKTFCY